MGITTYYDMQLWTDKDDFTQRKMALTSSARNRSVG